ncbi:unnamed protein product [Spirodela intermedia]|uniref:J domain-containing protein n=1 Tax=Spirodela intermedia TaxID=51605 RepID=A0A7I8IMD6_SPIIN|nr:unnamed protein product [Spirodela intermedia]CAA6658700.1 unnamed protein product [Spirodela intermedia]
MDGGGEIGGGAGAGGGWTDFYTVLGLKRQCSTAELRNAYKKLAMRWHPDRCFAVGNSKTVEEAKAKFQSIQEAYSVLSDTNKRFMYDVGVLDGDGDDADDDFMREMIAMMNKTQPGSGDVVTFEELQSLFMEMFEGDAGVAGRKRSGAEISSTTKPATVYHDAATGFFPCGNSRRVSHLILATWIYLIGSSPNYAARVSDNRQYATEFLVEAILKLTTK